MFDFYSPKSTIDAIESICHGNITGNSHKNKHKKVLPFPDTHKYHRYSNEAG
jgi:hypothetical protein